MITKDAFKNTIIIILLILLALTQIFPKKVKVDCPEYVDHKKSDTTITVDTTVTKHEVVGTTKPKKVKTISYHPTIKDSIETAQSISSCKDTIIFNNDIPIDSVGFINIEDTVTNNEIVGRRYKAIYNIPTITKTITIKDSIFIKETKRTQWYVGGEIDGNQFDPFSQASIGILIKNKKDGVFGAKINLDINGKVTYGIQKYWKIKLKK